jgi:hypothetical protein
LFDLFFKNSGGFFDTQNFKKFLRVIPVAIVKRRLYNRFVVEFVVIADPPD